MDQDKIEYLLLKLIKIGIFATLLTPLILGPFGINFVEYPKAVFFRSLIEIIFIFYIALILFDKKYLPKKSILLVSLSLFYTVTFISSIFGINFYRSFFGDMPRGEGLIMHLHLLAFFIITTSILLKREEWLNLFKASVLISGLSSVAALLQQAGVAWFYSMDHNRLSGTLSNPDLFACYIVLSIFITIFLLAIEPDKNFKVLWSSLIILNCYTLFFSGTRGSWVGFIAGIVSILFFNFLNLNYKKRIIIISIIIVVCVLIALLFLNAQWINTISKGSILSRVININLSGRIDIWKAALIAIKDRPILGWGFESFAFISDKYMNVLGGGFYFDRVHNKVLELLVYGGIIGFISYLLIFAVIFYLIFKYAKLWDGYNKKPKIICASILAAFFFCYFIQNIFAFDNIGTYILFFIVIGFIDNVVNNPSESYSNIVHTKTSVSKANKYRHIFIFKIIFISFIFFIMAEIMYQINLKPTIAAMTFPSFIIYENTDVQRSFYGYKQGISMNTIYDDDLRLTFIDRVLYILESNSVVDIKKDMIKTLSEVKPFLYKSIENHEEQINHAYQFIARINEQEYLQDRNTNSLDEMEKILSKAIAFNPNVAVPYQLMGELKIFQNNYNEGEEYIKKNCILDGSDNAILYRKIGNAYLKKGDINLALKNFEKIIDINYKNKKQTQEPVETSLSNAKFIDYVATTYYKKLNDIQNCRRIYEKGSEIYPEFANSFKQRLETITTEINK